MRPRRIHGLRRTGPGSAQNDPDRTHPLPGTQWHVGWAQETESYYVTGPGAPTGVMESVQALAEALAPLPVPEHVRAALHADRAARPPIADAWRRRITAVQALLDEQLPPEARPEAMVYERPLAGGAATADPHPVLVQVDPGHHAAAAALLDGAGYPLLAPPAPGAIIVAQPEHP